MSNVLIVDDMNTVREAIGKVVQLAGHNPVYAADGNEVLDKARSVKPALILLDVVMPTMDGFQACRAIKNDPELKNIPVVLVTSKNTDSDKFWGQKQGADDMLAKPFTDDALAAVIKRFAH